MSFAAGMGAGFAIGIGAGIAAGRRRSREAVLTYIKEQQLTVQTREGRALDPEDLFDRAVGPVLSSEEKNRKLLIVLVLAGVLFLTAGVLAYFRFS